MTIDTQKGAAPAEQRTGDGLSPGQFLTTIAPTAASERLALELLDAMERRALAEAELLLAADFTMVFPGPAVFTDLQKMTRLSAHRYLHIGKQIAVVESFHRDGLEVVYVRGVLHGANLQGMAFAGIRFIDRFEIKDGKIVRQDVWNDLAESGVLTCDA